MGKNIRRLLIAIGTVLAVLIVLAGIRVYRMLSDQKQMTPVATGEIVPGVYAIKDSYVNMYLVKGADGYVAMDAGNSSETVRTELRSIHVDPAAVRAVFLTHSDQDHVGGLPAFANATIFLSKEEEQMIDGRTARFAVMKNKPIPAHEQLDDGQVVEANGLKVTAIFTPGHTPGAACYLVDGRYLFVGDSMRLRNGKADIFSKAINMDSATQLRSLKKLAGLKGVQYAFTAHFGYTDSFDKAFQAFRE